MPGIVGFVKQTPAVHAEKLITDMAHALEPDGRFHSDLHHGGGYGLGRVSLRISNPEPQPVWNERHTICLVMEGELYDTDELKAQLAERGHRFSVNNDPELLLRLYEEYGEMFAAELNGAFVAAVWDSHLEKLTVANDRMGLYPLYYAHFNGELLFGSGVRALLADPDMPRTVDRIAINQFLVFDHVLGERTLLEHGHLLPQASVLTFHNRQLEIRPYWTLKYPQTYENRSEATYIEQLNHYLKQAIARQSPGDTPAGILLSGGLDSRALLTILRDGVVDDDFHSFTWGIPGADDVRFAKEIAKHEGVRHHYFELKPDWLLGLAEEGVRITDGLGNIINLHALATLKEESEYAQIIYKGFLGDAMFGFALKPQFWADYPPEVEPDIHLQVHNEQGVVNYTRAEQEMLFTAAFRQKVGNAVYDAYLAGMRKSGVKQLANQRLYFDLTQRVPRMTINGVEVTRSRTMVRLPFADNDLLDFALTVPPGFLYERHLMKAAFVKAYPKIAQIPFTGTGLPMAACARDVQIRAQRWLRWHLQKAGLGRFAGAERRPYKDYNTWFRTVLRDWVEGTLLSERALQRGYFQPEYVRQLVAEHMAGADHTGRLGALMTIELWHKQFID